MARQLNGKNSRPPCSRTTRRRYVLPVPVGVIYGRRDAWGGEFAFVVEGELVLGRFTVGERIGDGGHGTVHRAWDERLCRWVAVKAVEGDSAGRVLREAHAAARLNHPGIVTLYELGEHNGCAYLVSELVEGPNLRELAAAGEISDREVADVGAELCAALTHAHAAGVVHRDLKPDNVLVRRARAGRFSRDSGERALLADFGIASVEDEQSLTATGQVVGTLAYMSPEQAMGEEVGAPTDVYSLGLTLYELWAGFNPVAQGTPAATARAIGEPVASLGAYRPELPPALAAAIDACLGPDPLDRPAPSDLREALMLLRGALHPDRAVPEPESSASVDSLHVDVPTRPLAILLGAAAVALVGSLLGLPGLAIVTATLLAPAALALTRVREWATPALAPALGLVGAAPAFLAIAARHERNGGRAALAALAWAWTAIVGAIMGETLGVSAAGIDSSGWAGSGPTTMDSVLGSLLTPTAISIGLIWVGGTVLLGLLLDATGPAGAAVGGLIWSAMIAASLGAAGADAVPSILLAPALVIAVGVAIWDRHGRPDPREWLPESVAVAPTATAIRARPAAGPRPAAMRPPLNPAASPPADEEIRATRTARRHVRAALHGAGSRAGLP